MFDCSWAIGWLEHRTLGFAQFERQSAQLQSLRSAAVDLLLIAVPAIHCKHHKGRNEYELKNDFKFAIVKTLTEWIASRGCKQLIYQIQRPAPFPDCYTNVWDAEVLFWPHQLCRFVHCVGHIPADNRYSLERLTANWHCHGNDFVQQPIPMKRRKLVVQLRERTHLCHIKIGLQLILVQRC